MRYLKLFSILSLLTLCISSKGAIVERIVLKDGSVLEGHIVSQIPGKSINFYSEITTFVLTGNNVVEFHGSNEYDVDDSEWKEWANGHKELLVNRGNKRFIRVTQVFVNQAAVAKDDKANDFKNLLLKNATNAQVVVLQRGETIQYVDITPKRNLEIEYKNIDRIEKLPRPKDVISGVVDILQFKENRSDICGQILSQKLGESIVILDENINEKQEVSIKDIKCQKKQKLNEKQDFFEQVEFLERVSLKEGKDQEGIIVEQFISDKPDENYILILTKQNHMERIQNTTISNITRVENPAYISPITDIEISNDSIYLCRQSAQKIDGMVYNDNTIYVDLPLDSVQNVISQGKFINKKFVVECINNNENNGMAILPVSKKEIKVAKTGFFNTTLGLKDVISRYGFTFKELTENAITPSYIAEVTPNNTLRKEYDLDKGVYILYRPSDKMCVLFKIEE